MVDAAKPPPVVAAVKPAAAIKRPSAQRSNSISKGGVQATAGFGKVLHFLKQMELEVAEADRTVKDQARDMKHLVRLISREFCYLLVSSFADSHLFSPRLYLLHL